MDKKIFISQLYNLITNNNKIIEAIEQKKNINIEKAIKACMRSNTIIANILINYFEDKPKQKVKPSGDSEVDKLKDIFGMFD